ncbi:kinase [Planosporangium sp. 12N6]|uniref:kinase n=1 Tax=Planosporangium spinosum TaxID=3402278 RepID=UPI003CEBB337
MISAGIALYGPPAAGKDTITAALHRLDPRYVGFGKLKLAEEHGDSTGYRITTEDELAALRATGQVIYENARYRNRYIVDRPGLDAAFAAGHIPVVHMGQVAGVRALLAYPAAWTTVLLWCPREVTAERARLRGSRDIDARLTAWDETATDLRTATPDEFALRIDTDRHTPDVAAALIDAAIRYHAGSVTA